MTLLENIFNANSVASAYIQSQDINNTLPMIGGAWFPPRKKVGLTLNDIRTRKGLHVQLAASNFDAMPTLRTRGSFSGSSREMAFFRESMLVREHDLIELMKVQEMEGPFLDEILSSIYDDTTQLIQGAAMIPEIMRMQLLAPVDGSPKIYIDDNGVLYEYDYDSDGTYSTENFAALTGADAWTATDTANPFDNFRTVKRALSVKGAAPRFALMNQHTFDLLTQLDSVRNAVLAQNITANIYLDDGIVNRVWQDKTGTEIIIYDKMRYDKATGTTVPYYPDNLVTFIPEGTLGNTWYGTTPEERTLLGDGNVDVSIVDPGVAVAVKREYGPPVTITTTASMIVLPSYERMDETFVLKVAD